MPYRPLLAVLVACAVACGSLAAADDYQYRNTELRFTMAVPQEWTLDSWHAPGDLARLATYCFGVLTRGTVKIDLLYYRLPPGRFIGDVLEAQGFTTNAYRPLAVRAGWKSGGRDVLLRGGTVRDGQGGPRHVLDCFADGPEAVLHLRAWLPGPIVDGKEPLVVELLALLRRIVLT